MSGAFDSASAIAPPGGMPEGVDAWVNHLAGLELPVLRGTADSLTALRRDADNVSGHKLSATILHDPMMTLRVLQYLQIHRPPRLREDLTTIEHVVMMLGLTRFFAHFNTPVTLESALARAPDALEGARRVLYRARHAALYAREWAVKRHDIEVDEVCIAALLHDMAEMLLWCCMPELAQAIEALLQREPALRSRDAQVRVLGFPLIELQLELAARWNLPPLLNALMDDSHAATPRVTTVALAVRLARHAFLGWHHPALLDDYAEIQKLLEIPTHEVAASVRRTTLAAAREWQWYGIAPAAALWPLLPEKHVDTSDASAGKAA